MGKKLVDAARELESRDRLEFNAKLEKEIKRREKAESESAYLQTIIDHQAALLERQRKSFKLPPKAASSGEWYRVIIPDSHGSNIDDAAAGAFLRDLEYIQPREVVCIGDHLDCGGFLAQHHVWGYVAETEYTFAADVSRGNEFFDEVQSRCPLAKFYYLEGNHERRIETWCVTQALRNGHDAAFLKSKFGVEASLHLSKRGFEHFEQGKSYHGFSVPATIRLGHCVFTHGDVNARGPARKMLSKFGTNVVFGHNHCGDMCVDRLLEKDIFAACVQSLCKRQPMWRHTHPSNWSHGYGLQRVFKGGMCRHSPIPIVDGKSLLGAKIGELIA